MVFRERNPASCFTTGRALTRHAYATTHGHAYGMSHRTATLQGELAMLQRGRSAFSNLGQPRALGGLLRHTTAV